MAATAIARPNSGEVITTAWGTQVADAHNGIQAGTVSAVFSAATSVVIALVFPRAYASAPIVVAAGGGNNATILAAVGGITATGCNIIATQRDAASTSGTFPINWIAVGVMP